MYNILTLGSTCYPASVLRYLNLRDFALPFNWIVSDINGLEQCFDTNFEKFHKKLRFNSTKKRLIDEYGFEYPHDYPIISNNQQSDFDVDKISESEFAEEDNKHICDNWLDYYPVVLEKYNRRIERFKNIVYDTKPIIALCQHPPQDIIKIKQLFITYFNKHNIIFINSSHNESICDNIINAHTEIYAWNDMTIWKKWIDFAIYRFTDTDTDN